MANSSRDRESKRETTPRTEPRAAKEPARYIAHGDLAAARALLGDGGGDAPDPTSPSVAAALHAAGRALGNHFVERSVAARRPPPPRVARSSAVQAKLLVGDEADPLEREADELADLLLAPLAFAAPPKDEASDARTPLAWSSTTSVHHPFGVAVPDELTRDLDGLETGGEQLSPADRAFFEPRLGLDLAAVRVHTDARAVALCAALQARAFTRGRHIVLGRHAHAPGTAAARRLIAHELVHVLQQGGVPLAQPGPAPDAAAAPHRITRAPASLIQRETFKLADDILVGTEVKNGVTHAHIVRRNDKGQWVGVAEVVIPKNEDPLKYAMIAVSIKKTSRSGTPAVSREPRAKEPDPADAFYEIDVTVPAGLIVRPNRQSNQSIKKIEKSVEDMEREDKAKRDERNEVWAFVEREYREAKLEYLKRQNAFWYHEHLAPDGLPYITDQDMNNISARVDDERSRQHIIDSPEFQKHHNKRIAGEEKERLLNNMMQSRQQAGFPISRQEAEAKLAGVLAYERAEYAAARQRQHGAESGPRPDPQKKDERSLDEQLVEQMAARRERRQWEAQADDKALAGAAERVGILTALRGSEFATDEEVRRLAAFLGRDLPGASELEKRLNQEVRDHRADLEAHAALQLSLAVQSGGADSPEAQHWRRVLAGRSAARQASGAEEWRPGIAEDKRREKEERDERNLLLAVLAPHFALTGSRSDLEAMSTPELKEWARKLRWDGPPTREAMISLLSLYLHPQASRADFRRELDDKKVTDDELMQQLVRLGLGGRLSPWEREYKRKYNTLPPEITNEKGDLVGYRITEVKEEAMGGRLRVTIRTIDPSSGIEQRQTRVVLTPATAGFAQAADFAIDFIPYVGVAKAAIQAVFGVSLSLHDLAMDHGGRALSVGERIDAALGAIPGTGRLAKVAAVAGKVSQAKMALEIVGGVSLSGRDIDDLLAGKPLRKLTPQEKLDKIVMGGMGHIVSVTKGKFEQISAQQAATTKTLESGKPPVAPAHDIPDGLYLSRDEGPHDLSQHRPRENAQLHLELLKGQHDVGASIDARGGNRVEVKFTRDRLGRVKKIDVVMGPEAMVRDLEQHLPVIVALKQYQGLAGLGRVIVDAVRRRLGNREIEAPGDPGFRIKWEVDKLRDLMAARVNDLASTDAAGRQKLIAEIAQLRDQMTEWQNKVNDPDFDPHSVEMRNTGEHPGRPPLRPERKGDLIDPRKPLPEDLAAYLEQPDSQRYGAEKPTDPGDGPVELKTYVKQRGDKLSITVNLKTDKAGVGHATADFDPATGELYRDNIHVNPHEKCRNKGHSRTMSNAILEAVRAAGHEVRTVKGQLYETNFEVLKNKGVYETPFYKGLPPEFKYVVYLGERWFKVYKHWEDVARDTGLTGPPPPDHALRPPKGPPKRGGPVPPPALAEGVFRSPVHEQLLRWNDESFARLESDPSGVAEFKPVRTQARRVGDQTHVGATGAHVASVLPELITAAQAHVQKHPGQTIRMLTAEVRNLSGLNPAFGTSGARQVLAGLFNELTLTMRLELESHRTSVSLVHLGGSRIALVVVGPAGPDRVYAATQRGLLRARKYADTLELPPLNDPSAKIPIKDIPHPKYPNDPLEKGTGISVVQWAFIDPATPAARQIEQWSRLQLEQRDRAEAARKRRNPDRPKFDPDDASPEAIPDVPRPEGPRSKFELSLEESLAAADARRTAAREDKPGELPRALFVEAADVLRAADADALGLHAPAALVPMLDDAVAWKQRKNDESAAVVAYDVRNLGGLGEYLGRDVSPGLYKHMVDIVQQTLARELPTASVKGCHYGGDEFGFLAVGTFTKDQAEAARIKAAAAVKEWADRTTVTLKATGERVPLRTIPHLKDGKLPGTGITGAVVMIEQQTTGLEVLESLNAVDRAKAVAKEAQKKRKKDDPPDPTTPPQNSPPPSPAPRENPPSGNAAAPAIDANNPARNATPPSNPTPHGNPPSGDAALAPTIDVDDPTPRNNPPSGDAALAPTSDVDNSARDAARSSDPNLSWSRMTTWQRIVTALRGPRAIETARALDLDVADRAWSRTFGDQFIGRLSESDEANIAAGKSVPPAYIHAVRLGNAIEFASLTNTPIFGQVLRHVLFENRQAMLDVGAGGHGGVRGDSFLVDRLARDPRFVAYSQEVVDRLRAMANVWDLTDPRALRRWLARRAAVRGVKAGTADWYTIADWCWSAYTGANGRGAIAPLTDWDAHFDAWNQRQRRAGAIAADPNEGGGLFWSSAERAELIAAVERAEATLKLLGGPDLVRKAIDGPGAARSSDPRVRRDGRRPQRPLAQRRPAAPGNTPPQAVPAQPQQQAGQQKHKQQAAPAPRTYSHIPGGSLDAHEKARGNGIGHTIRDHCNKSLEELHTRVSDPQKYPVASTFINETSANYYVNECLREKAPQIAAWLRSGPPIGKEERFELKISGKVGERVLRDSRPGEYRDCDRVVVILKPDPRNPDSFLILTAYPE